MRDEEPVVTGDCHAAAVGMLQCLQMLADEADRRSLFRTRVALRRAIRACRAEQAAEAAAVRPRTRRSLALH